jgi:2'-5' RNA ligase
VSDNLETTGGEQTTPGGEQSAENKPVRTGERQRTRMSEGGGERPNRPYTPREGGERKPYTPREGGGRGGYQQRSGGGGNRGGGYQGNRNNPRGQQRGGPRRDGAKPEMHMYYLTVLCPLDIDESIHEHKNFMRRTYGCDVASKSPAHITLIAPFFMSMGKRNELVEKLESFESIISEINVNLNGYGCFDNRVIFVDVEANENLTTLQEQVETYVRNNGFPFIKEAKKPFHPHVTIATRDLKPEDFEAAWPEFEGKEYTASFTTNTMHLMKLVDERWIHEKQFVL